MPTTELSAAAPRPGLPAGALLLAPMVALSHRALRELIYDFGGLDLAFTEMASAGAAVSGSVYEAAFLDAQPRPEATVIQFYTTKAERLLEALAYVQGRGVFGVDLNFGCSAPQIVRAGGGSAWMHKPAEAADLVGQARGAWTDSLSAKIRLGGSEDYPALLDFCRGLEAAGLDFLTLHPRLDTEKFRHKSRWDFVGRLGRDLGIPVAGNGDVVGVADYLARVAEARPAGVMVGRGAAQRPWLFALIKGRLGNPDFSLTVDREAVARRFLDLLRKDLPRDLWQTRARRFFFYYSDNFTYAHHLKWKLDNAPDLETMEAILGDYFKEVPQDRIKVETD